jgi:hypothetical protein
MKNECGCNGNCGCVTNKTPLNGSSNVSNHTFDIGNTGTVTVNNFNMYNPKTVVDVVVNAEEIVITYIQRALYSYTTINHTLTIAGGVQQIYNPDKVFKEVYGVKDGKLTLLRTIDGRIVPPVLEESYEFDEE